MMRFKRILNHLRHFQLPGPMFVVGADCGGVKPALHAFFEESPRAKYLLHRRLRRFGSGLVGRACRHRRVIFEAHILALGGLSRSLELRYRGIARRIGYVLCQKSAFIPFLENMGTSNDSIPFPVAPAADALRGCALHPS